MGITATALAGLDLRVGPVTGSRVAWLITYTPAPDEPRLLRQAATLVRNGWRVVVCGYEGSNPPPPDWTFLSLVKPPPADWSTERMLALRRKLGRRIGAAGIAARLYQDGIHDWRSHRRTILRTAQRHPDLRPGLVIAHDYLTCPAADALARVYDAAVIVDSHEYMLEASPDDPDWVANMRPMVRAMQDHFFARADQVIAVSDGIVERLNTEQRMRRPARLIRNMPPYLSQPFRAATGPVTVLYHGIIDPARDIAAAIEAAALWASDAKLVLRGPCAPSYADYLRGSIASRNIGHRVTIEPPVPVAQMIERANSADIGYFVYADGNPQRRFTLPNKFFEYVMAGLALVVSDLPEMSRLLRHYRLGIAVPDTSPRAIADAVDAMTPSRINEFKRASLAAARELCWEREEAVFLEIVRDVCGPA
jgi:glycogen synthase